MNPGYHATPEVMGYITGGQPTSREEIRDEIIPFHLATYDKHPGFRTWAADDIGTGRVDHPLPLAVLFTQLTGREHTMSLGGSPADGAWGKERFDRLKARADADRAARLAGRKPLFRRLLEHLRPHREEPGSDPGNFPGTPSDPGR
jgi:hypothetical protein